MSPETHTNRSLSLWRETLAGLDWMALRLSGVYAGTGVPQGDGAPVVVVPGLFASDASLIELEGWLRRVGYRPYLSGIGRNIERPGVTLPRLTVTIDRAHAETGRRVILIGHSLGGLLARGAALRRPSKVAHVVTLGSPVSGVRVHPAILAAAELLCGEAPVHCIAELQHALPRDVTETNIYTQDDGVVDPTTCRRNDTPSIAVRGSHVALVANAGVFRALGSVLSEAVAAEHARLARETGTRQLGRALAYRAPAPRSWPDRMAA